MKFYILTILLLITPFAFAGTSGAKWDDFSQKQITQHLSSKLDKNTVAIRVKGLVCESCGIGLRKKLSKVKAVDTKRFNKGVEMDVYKMLLIVGVDEGKILTNTEVIKAVKDAGYEAVYFYQQDGKKVSVENL